MLQSFIMIVIYIRLYTNEYGDTLHSINQCLFIINVLVIDERNCIQGAI